MKISLLVLLFCAVTAFIPVTKKKRVVFFGDSITEAAVKPGGYIVKLDSMIVLQGKTGEYELVGAGVSGNKIYDLYLRMDEDVMAKKPNIVVIYIGINDVWHKTSSRTGTDYDKFEKFYHALIQRIQKSGSLVVICTPTLIGEKYDSTNENDGDLNYFSTVIRKIALDEKCKLIDLRKSFIEYETKFNTENKALGILTSDRVHLNEAGNIFLFFGFAHFF